MGMAGYGALGSIVVIVAKMASKEGKTATIRTVPRNLADVQRLKLDKLMENPDKIVPIPERHRDKTLPPPPEFNRNVMGSSAGAGSGEFHVYRHIRRREYARQKLINEKARRENLDEAYHHKLEENKRLAEEKTAKKRAKRLKQKQKKKFKKAKPNTGKEETKDDESEDESEDSENGEESNNSESSDKINEENVEESNNSENSEKLNENVDESK